VLLVVGKLGEEVCLRSFGKGFIGRLDRISFGVENFELEWMDLG